MSWITSYTFASGDGIDLIEDAAGQNTIQFRNPANTAGTAITLASVVAQRLVGAGGTHANSQSNSVGYKVVCGGKLLRHQRIRSSGSDGKGCAPTASQCVFALAL
jgi:hypothetical protein